MNTEAHRHGVLRQATLLFSVHCQLNGWVALCLIRFLMLVLLNVTTQVATQAQKLDSIQFRFQTDSTCVDFAKEENQRAWQAFEKMFHRNLDGVATGFVRLDIFCGASPEGSASRNLWLGEQRGRAIGQLVNQHFPHRVDSIVVHNEGARWQALYDSIAASHEPWRDEAMAILRMTPSVDASRSDHRELRLRSLRGGQAWTVIRERYLPPLRSGATAVLSWRLVRDTIWLHDTVRIFVPVPYQDTSTAAVAEEHRDNALLAYVDSTTCPRHTVVRTNLLYLATASLNASIDIGLSCRWSLSLTAGFNPWKYPKRNRADNKIVNPKTLHWLVMPELRFWPRGHLQRGYIGVYGQYAQYNVGGISFIPALNNSRYDGYLYGGGISIGWHWWLGKKHRTGLEASIGVGYLRLHYDKYRACNCSGLIETTGKNYFGPTKAALSLTYLIK